MGEHISSSRNVDVSAISSRVRSCVVADQSSCTGCGICVAICSIVKTGEVGIDAARLRVERDSFAGRFEPVVCLQCPIPHCMNACKKAAITISQENGSVVISEADCIGCRACQKACPFGVIVFVENSKKAYKCDLCQGNPACVESCPAGALGIANFKGRVW
jgi:anaerobic carbon-monoxide dehydrogenase iron sulfur subunit